MISTFNLNFPIYIFLFSQNNATPLLIIFISYINKFLLSLTNRNKINDLFNEVKKSERIHVVINDDQNQIKSLSYEEWFKNLFSINDGLWIGKGVSDQSLIRITTITKEMREDLKNNMGYLINENYGTLVKLIDFVSEEEK